MIIGRVRGNVVATQKHEKLAGKKLLVVELCTLDEKTSGRLKFSGQILAAVDTVGAGDGEYVLVTQAAEASPADAVIVGIIDKVNLPGQPIDLSERV